MSGLAGEEEPSALTDVYRQAVAAKLDPVADLISRALRWGQVELLLMSSLEAATSRK